MVQLDLPIVTDRLRIRRFTLSDRPAFLAFMLDPGSTAFLMFPDQLKTEAGASGLLNDVLSRYNTDQPIHFSRNLCASCLLPDHGA